MTTANGQTPLLSLVIPTRERAHTLQFTLATALDQASLDYEVVVSDNDSGDDTRQVVQRLDDGRVRYFNTGRRLSMCGNYEFALEQARGRYVAIIGDDDAVMPGALDYLLACLRAAPELVIHMWPLHIYDWPVDSRPAQVAYLAPEVPASELQLKSKARRIMTLGGWKYYELPSPYHAAIPRQVLDAIRSRTGRVFHSTQPDVFTAMAIPAFADRAVNLGRTITLNGRSAKSNGLGFVNKTALANIELFIREYGNYGFHPTLYSGVPAQANMIPDAVLIARDLFPDLYSSVPFNYSAMWAYMCRLRFVSHHDVLSNQAHIRKAHAFKLWTFMSYSMVHEISILRRRMLNRLTPLGSLKAAVPANIRDFVRVLAAQTASFDP
jgi:glycosyltransferase involved in cell wall biosynthesis